MEKTVHNQKVPRGNNRISRMRAWTVLKDATVQMPILSSLSISQAAIGSYGRRHKKNFLVVLYNLYESLGRNTKGCVSMSPCNN